MGLFSNKNKRDRAFDDSGRFYSKDDDAAIGERARAKRASHAGASAGASRRPGNDPMLPEKKRARRRLVGAIALALAVAIGLPMLLDSEPRQLAGDIAIQIPSKDKAAPLPVPAAPADDDAAASSASATEAAKPAASGASTRPKTVAAADSVDQGEEVIDAPPPTPKAPKLEAPKLEARKPEHKEPKPEHKDVKADKPEHKPEPVKPKPEDKPAKAHEDARALAILEGKAEAKSAESRAAEPKAEAAGGPKAMVQVAAMSSDEKAAEVQAKLRAAGISSTTEKSANGLVRVKIGPYTKDEAEKARAKVARLGL